MNFVGTRRRGPEAEAVRKRISEVDKHVGARIRMRRMMIGMAQTDIASRLRISFQQVQKYERGVNRVSASRLHDFAGVLGVSVTFFFEERPSTATAVSLILSLLSSSPHPTAWLWLDHFRCSHTPM
jgi:transcriptional regulator with XRE-family HTH domain